MKIGIFDSGLGGLSVFREILKVIPEYDFVYLGDNARVPYGGRSADLIYQFTKNAVNFLFKNDCQIIIIACNTATANALRKLQQEYLPRSYPERRILGVIKPVVEVAAESGCKKIGVMATRATVASGSYPVEIKKLNPSIQVFQEACPLLAPIIEEGELDWEGLDSLIKKHLKSLLIQKIDGLILGCTHYALIEDKVKKYLPLNVKIISQGKATAIKLKDYLKRHTEVTRKLSKNGVRVYFATDLNQKYQDLTKLFLGDFFNTQHKLILVNL